MFNDPRPAHFRRAFPTGGVRVGRESSDFEHRSAVSVLGGSDSPASIDGTDVLPSGPTPVSVRPAASAIHKPKTPSAAFSLIPGTQPCFMLRRDHLAMGRWVKSDTPFPAGRSDTFLVPPTLSTQSHDRSCVFPCRGEAPQSHAASTTALDQPDSLRHNRDSSKSHRDAIRTGVVIGTTQPADTSARNCQHVVALALGTRRGV